MDLGFETVGNATLICHDRVPVLVTDPWIDGSAYFGSWTRSHEIPHEQRQNISRCRFIWVSHGHPDHLSADSLAALKGKKILLPDHVGSRIYDDLKKEGYNVDILRDRKWISLSDRIRILSIADYLQDGILLVDLGGTLIINLNDANANDRGWARFVRRVANRYPISFLLKLCGSIDADMINVYDETGKLISKLNRFPIGRQVASVTEWFNAKYFIPFSSLHKYQRADSVWANQYTRRLDEYHLGFESKACELLPAFVRYDCAKRRLEQIHPRASETTVISPDEFGDSWSDPLSREDEKKISTYFRAIEHLRDHFDFIRTRVGGKEYTVDLAGEKTGKGITFEAPRNSLITAIEYEIFDDMLIGNFMRTTLHGDHGNRPPLYPDFTPYVGKYADNGRARTKEELETYFAVYRRRALLENLLQGFERYSKNALRTFVSTDSPGWRVIRNICRHIIPVLTCISGFPEI